MFGFDLLLMRFTERFRTITTAYYRGAMGILLVYDVTDEKSFGNIRTWIKNIEQHASESVNKILVGNKCDLLDQKVVDEEAARALAAEYGIKFMEASAKSNIGVDDAFITLAKDIKARLIDPGSEAGGTADAGGGSAPAGATVLSGDDLRGANGQAAAKKDAGCCK